ncbi:MAG: hypothetical protein WCO26_00870 [Deltaproteobacteria bacterium]
MKLFGQIIPNIFKRKARLFLENILDSFAYYLHKGRNGEVRGAKNIVFICRGNICRSPFAASSLKRILDKQNIQIESYGLDVAQSSPPPPEAIVAAEKYGVNITEHKSRAIEIDRVKESDLIISMEYTHYKEIVNLFPGKKNCTRLLREFAPFPNLVLCNINDPYGCESNEYERCFSLIEKSLHCLVEKVMERKERSKIVN